MKRIILTAMLAMGALTVVNAQEISFGAKVGGQLTNLVGDDIEGQQAKIGAYGGVFVNFGLTEDILIQPELLFSMQGTKVEDNHDARLNYNYLNIPVMFQYKLTDEIYGEFGPQLGILLKAEGKNDIETVDLKEVSETINLGLNFGFGYIMENGLGINARYGLGLSSVIDVDDDDDIDIKHSVISFGLSYNL